MSQDFHFDFRHSAMCVPSLPLSTSRHALHRSKPRPHTHDQTNLTRIATFLAHEGSRLAEAFVEGEADIGRKLAPDFIAEPKPKFQVVEPRAGRELLDSLDGGVGFKAWLEDQSFRQQQVLGHRQPGGHRAVLIDKHGGLQCVTVRHESLDPDRAEPPGHVASTERLRLDAWADLNIIIFLDEPPIQELKVHIIVCVEGRAPLSFAFEPESVVVPAVPTFDIPPVVARTFTSRCARAVFEYVDEREQTMFLIVDGSRPVVWRRYIR